MEVEIPALPPITYSAPPPPLAPSTSARITTRVYHARDLLASRFLTEELAAFINQGYKNDDIYNTSLWYDSPTRFHAPEELHDTLGRDGLIAVTYNDREPVACASVSRWEGDMNGVVAENDMEGGWEIKAVTTKRGWYKMGLVGRCIGAMSGELLRQDGGKVKLWLHAVEEVNGEYWRRRGWKEVRRFTRPAGFWDSKKGFQLVVMVKEVSVQSAEVTRE